MTEFEDAMGLVRFHAHRIHARVFRHIELADLVQEGVVGLLEAQQRYVPGKVSSLAKFASRRIKGAMYDFVRAQIPGSRYQLRAPDILSLETPVFGDNDGDELTIGETLTSADDPERDAIEAERSRQLASAVDSLCERDRQVIRRLYFDGNEVPYQSTVARAFGVGASRISQIRTKALGELRRALSL